MTTTTFASGYLEIPLTGALLFAGGEIASVANPEGVPVVITDVKILVTTPSTGAATISVGIAAAATTSDNDMIDALDINGAAAGSAYHGMTALAAKGAAQVWGATQYVTATGSADTTGFVGKLYVQYNRTA
jgi:hypothetical protein